MECLVERDARSIVFYSKALEPIYRPQQTSPSSIRETKSIVGASTKAAQSRTCKLVKVYAALAHFQFRS